MGDNKFMKKISLVIILSLCLFGGVGAVLANSFELQKKEQKTEDTCALGKDKEQITQDKNSSTPDDCMEAENTKVID
jgi:hypothetical protein